jgi:hypothetical protein
MSDEEIAYCVKCRAKKPMADHAKTVNKKGRHYLRGKCVDCGTTMCRILKKESAVNPND